MGTRSEQAEEHRARVLDSAARLFRERGFSGVGVADLMKDAGLTHGGFYWHFKSKDNLKAEAIEHASKHTVERWQELVAKHPEDALAAWMASYLSGAHRDDVGMGCPVAALAGDAAREGSDVREALTEAAKSLFGALCDLVPGASPSGKRQRAAATLAGMVGAIVLSRAVSDAAFSNEILRAVRVEANATDAAQNRS